MDTEAQTKAPSPKTPIACTLNKAEATEQLLKWVDLQHLCSEVEAVQGGVRMRLPASLADRVADLVRTESRCCSFLTIETSVIGEVLTVDISSPDPDALPVISTLAGIPLP